MCSVSSNAVEPICVLYVIQTDVNSNHLIIIFLELITFRIICLLTDSQCIIFVQFDFVDSALFKLLFRCIAFCKINRYSIVYNASFNSNSST